LLDPLVLRVILALMAVKVTLVYLAALDCQDSQVFLAVLELLALRASQECQVLMARQDYLGQQVNQA